MANGPIGRVAATQAQQGGTYSDAINQQVDLIQKQRALNLQNRLAQEKENRKFRDQQRQNIYDFDVTGLAPEYAEQIKKTQDKMSEWLQPGSEVRYENQEQLTKDIANLNNMYLWGKRFSTTARAAESQFEESLVNGSSIPGTKMAEGEDGLINRRDAFNTGGFKNMEVTGGPGGISIIGIPIEESPQGNGAFMFNDESDKVDVLSREADGSFVFRTPLIKDLYNVDQKYVDATSAEMAGKKADSDWDSNPRSVQLEYREKLADSDPRFADKNDQGEFVVSDEELKELHRKEAEGGWNTFHEAQVPFSMVSNTPMISDSGSTLYKLKDDKGKDTTIGLFTGGERREVTHLGTTGSGENTMIVYEYTDPDDSNRVIEASVPFNSAEGYALMEDAGYVGAIAKLVADNPNLSIEDLREQFGATGESAGDETTTTEGEGTGEGEVEGTEAEEQQATPAPDTIGDYRTALEDMAVPTGLGFGFMQLRSQKLAKEIKDEPLATQAKRIDEEIAKLEEETANVPSYRRDQTYNNRLEALENLRGLKEKLKGSDTPEAKATRIDNIESRIADIDVELLDLQGRGNQKAKNRRKLEAEKLSLRGQIAGLDPDYYAATQIPSERPEVTAAQGPAIQGQGAGIAYSKPQPPQDIDAFEVGDEAAGSTKPERKSAFEEAVRMAEEAGHPYPEAVAAQYALESGYGKKKAANYNYFGLKSSDAMIKRLAEAGIEATAGDPVATEEIIDGKSQTINDSFLSFKSPEDAFMAYLMFIDTTKKDGERRYGEALDESETALDYLKGIREAGYATANNYADSLNTVAKSFGIDLAEIERKPAGTASN